MLGYFVAELSARRLRSRSFTVIPFPFRSHSPRRHQVELGHRRGYWPSVRARPHQRRGGDARNRTGVLQSVAIIVYVRVGYPPRVLRSAFSFLAFDAAPREHFVWLTRPDYSKSLSFSGRGFLGRDGQDVVRCYTCSLEEGERSCTQ